LACRFAAGMTYDLRRKREKKTTLSISGRGFTAASAPIRCPKPDRLAEYDPVQNIVFINALAYDYAPEHEKAAVLRHSTFE
jgi:hypothetical protein